MPTSLTLTSSLRMLTCALTLLTPMVSSLMMLMRMRLRLNSHEKVLPRLRHRMYKHLIPIRPVPLKLLLLVVFRIRGFGHLVVDQDRMRGGVGRSARGIRAFDFGVLDAADTVVVVVYGCLEDFLLVSLRGSGLIYLIVRG